MLYEEVIPILPLDQQDCENFAASVTDRFNNPFMEHQLLSIALNSTAKWKARDMGSLLEYRQKFGKLPRSLVMTLAAYIAFYSSDIQERQEKALLCRRPQGDVYMVQDDDWVLDFYYEHRHSEDAELVHDVLVNEKMWGCKLTQLSGLEKMVLQDLQLIRQKGMKKAFASCLRACA